LRRVPPVHKDDAGPGPDEQRFDLAQYGMRDASCGMREPHLRDGCDAGEAPLLLLRGGEAQLREARDRALADLFEPRGRTSGAASRSQSYPFSSSSSASSLPPDFTMRPSASTCTKSGRMWVSIR